VTDHGELVCMVSIGDLVKAECHSPQDAIQDAILDAILPHRQAEWQPDR